MTKHDQRHINVAIDVLTAWTSASINKHRFDQRGSDTCRAKYVSGICALKLRPFASLETDRDVQHPRHVLKWSRKKERHADVSEIVTKLTIVDKVHERCQSTSSPCSTEDEERHRKKVAINTKLGVLQHCLCARRACWESSFVSVGRLS